MFTYSYAGVQSWGPSPRSRRSRSPKTSVFSRIRREQSRSPRQRSKEGGVFKTLESRGKSVSARSDSYSRNSHSKYTEALSESKDSEGGHWKSRSKKKKSYREEDDLSQPWVCEKVDPFIPRIRYFDFPKTRMPSHIKTYDRSEDPDDHLKIFQAATKTERCRIPLVKVRWNSKRGPEFTWEREDQFKKKYPHLFSKTAPSSSAAF
ncbi:hypothetical protein Tco_1578074 [Tanacetum coccineum]